LSSPLPPNQEAEDDLEFVEELIQEHMVVEQSLESVLKQQRAKKIQQPSPRGHVCALHYREFPVENFDEIRHIWEASMARHKSLEDGASISGKVGAAAVDVIVISSQEEV
jgi:hypothetical protein